MTSTYIALLVVNAAHFALSLILLLYTIGCKRTWFSAKHQSVIQIRAKRTKKKVVIWVISPATSRKEIFEEKKLIERTLTNITAEKEIKNLVLSLWNQNIVGIGRDAHNIRHKSIEILEIRMMTTSMSKGYKNRKLKLMNYASRMHSRKILAIQDYTERSKPIATMEKLTKGTSILRETVNEKLNEVYLFHGTKAENIPSIEERGFDVRMNKSSFVGRGLYFAESPVKADQYSDISTEHKTMILARVLLGKILLLKDNKFMDETNRPPCPTCLEIDCKKRHKIYRKPFDSVVLDRPLGLFREFVVFENCLAHPGYLITYKRL